MVRRVVTGHKAGKAAFVSDGTPPKGHVFKNAPGMEIALVWATPPEPILSMDGQKDPVSGDTAYLPEALAATSLLILTIPPDSAAAREDFDGAAAGAELAHHVPQIAAVQEADNPGMHRTNTVDYVVVLDGEICLELDDQQERVLKPHDIVIQNGTRHAWRNRSERPATLAVILVGAQRG